MSPSLPTPQPLNSSLNARPVQNSVASTTKEPTRCPLAVALQQMVDNCKPWGSSLSMRIIREWCIDATPALFTFLLGLIARLFVWLLQRRRSKQSAKSPFSRLPPEILGLIFTHGVESFDPPDHTNNYLYFQPREHVPISRYLDLYNHVNSRRAFLRTIMLTCRLWTNVAETTPQLWRYIDTNMHRDQFDKWIERCKNLDIELEHRSGFGYDNYWKDQVGMKIHSRNADGTLPPVSSLVVHQWGPGLPVGGPQFDGERTVPCSFTLPDRPNLNLTHLTLHKNGRWWKFEQLSLLLTCSPNLVSLRMTEQTMGHCIEPSRPRIPLIRLKHLVFVDVEHGHQILQSFHLPALESLLLAIDSAEGQDELGQTLEDLGNSTRRLKDLHLVSSVGSAEEEAAVRQFVCGQPNLEKLSLSFFSNRMVPALVDALLPANHEQCYPCPNLATVFVSFTPCEAQDFTRLLLARNFPSGDESTSQACRPISSLCIDHCNIDNWVGEELGLTSSVDPAVLPSPWRTSLNPEGYPLSADSIKLENGERVQPMSGATLYMVPRINPTRPNHPAAIQIINGPLPRYALEDVLNPETRGDREVVLHRWTTWYYAEDVPNTHRPISAERRAIIRLLIETKKTIKELGITPPDMDHDENHFTESNPNPFRKR